MDNLLVDEKPAQVDDSNNLGTEIWQYCLETLKENCSDQEFNTWIRPLQMDYQKDTLFLLAPNSFVVDWVKQNYLKMVEKWAENYLKRPITVIVTIGNRREVKNKSATNQDHQKPAQFVDKNVNNSSVQDSGHRSNLDKNFSIENFVKGKSNEFAFAAAYQVIKKLGGAYNPLLIYGGVGLGKTHLMQAVGNAILTENPSLRVQYLHSERFVANMVKALQTNAIDAFKHHYRSLDALLIDDIQFFAGKDRSQEEFFHTFNALLEDKKQIILTCDRYPKEIRGLKERLQSRFGWGLTVAIEPPELETRVAILMSKAEQLKVELLYDVAFFIAKRIRSNVRELEGALKRVIANAEFTGRPITVDFVKEALHDLISLQDKLVTIENIQRTVAEYYKIRLAELLSKRRSRSIARPRQLAMALAKELTNHSLPEIGHAFGGKDHTTVLHACRKIIELRKRNIEIQEDYTNILRILTT